MSIISAVCAEESNKKKREWVEKLEKAERDKDWNKIRNIIKEMKDFYFSE